MEFIAVRWAADFLGNIRRLKITGLGKMASFKQEMPPSGGYSPFEYAKQSRPRWLKGKWVLLGYAAWTAAALQWYKYNYKRTVIDVQLENREANIALEPIMMAERNRLFLKRLVDNREYEKEVMKDVPGWIPGTYYGSPVYHQKEIWADPSPEEFWAHSDYFKGYYGQRMERHRH